ncbi:MAG TPA: AMP-binding protein [Candidatus Nitrosotenuis sp.]|nr:AMP-binding protein [Candidatus Nitrosotenuis sp.]
MATTAPHLERTASGERVCALARDLLIELGSHRALEDVRPEAHLEKDLGLGSLERVELIARIGYAFQVTLPDSVAANAETVADLIAAVTFPSTATDSERELTSGGVNAPLQRMDGTPAVQGPGHLPDAQTLIDVLLHRATHDGPRPHIHLREESGASHVITFGELYRNATAIARGLKLRGLEPGQAVAIMLPTSAEFYACFFGVQLAGGFAVPIYPPMRADRIEEYAARQSAILRSAEARFLITFRQAEAVAHLLHPHVPSLKGVITAAKLASTANGAEEFMPHRARPTDLAFLQYTSGSTGEPKGVMLTHANLLANIRAIVDALEFRASDVGISWLPLYHDMGLIGTWLTLLYFGIPVAVMSPLAFLTRPERWLWAVHKHRGTLTAAPNFAFELCVRKIKDEDIKGLDLSSWRGVLNGAEPVNAATLDRFCERFAKYGFRPEALLPVYGLAEATLAVCAPPLERGPRVDRIDRQFFEREHRAVPASPDDTAPLEFVSVGRPLPSFAVRIVDEQGNEVADRVEGQLWFRGPSATQGYYRNPEATHELLKRSGNETWVDSGDRAYRADGEFYITGRVKDIIIKAGRNIYPHEVEEVTGGVEGVRRGCVVALGVNDPQAGTERLVVVAETRTPPRQLSRAERAQIQAAIVERVADAIGLPPDVIELVPAGSIPKTSSGKLRRNETRRLYLAEKLSTGKLPAWLQLARLAATGGARAARSVFRRALEFLYGCYALVAFAVFLVPTWLAAYFAPTRELACRATQIGTSILFKMIFVPVRVTGWEHLRAGGPWVMVSNHTSFFDVILYLSLFKFPYRFVSKKEVASWPFIGTFIRRRTDFAFTREDRNQRLEQAVALENSLREGVSLLIYPEGTFEPVAGVRPFQLGAFKAAYATRCPVVPIALRGPRTLLRDGAKLPRPTSIHVTILPPIVPDPDAPEFSEIVRMRDTARAAIAEHCGEHLL